MFVITCRREDPDVVFSAGERTGVTGDGQDAGAAAVSERHASTQYGVDTHGA